MSQLFDNDNNNVYQEAFEQDTLPDENYESFDLTLSDDDLQKMLVSSLDANRDYWNQAPWNLRDTDVENVKFFLGDQVQDQKVNRGNETRYVDNRLFSSTRAVLSYVTGQLATPEIIPSRSDDQYKKGARAIQNALYQHSLDEKVDQKVRSTILNLLLRKRGYMKLRWDPNKGANGDIVTEVCNPEDIIIDRFAGFMHNPNIIYHRLRCSVDELVQKFPAKSKQIYAAYSIKQGRYSQMSKYVTYYEAWFTYIEKGQSKEGVCWFIPDKNLILDKMPNPNWMYMKDPKKEKDANVADYPPKPFVYFNYLNLGHSFIDETCLFEQGKPMQILLNNRLEQIWENGDYQNGRWIASKKAFSEEDGYKLVNKGAKTVAMADVEDVNKAFANVSSAPLPQYVYNTMLDARNEIDTAIGTPSIFKGSQPETSDTLGRDQLVKQQAGMLQDDLVKAIMIGMEVYYSIKLQMMRVHFTDDYWFQTKGEDGEYEFIMLNGKSMDTDVKVGVQVDSTLPLDKAMIRSTALSLMQAQKIDDLSLFEDLGIPNPDLRAERLQKYQLNRLQYAQSIETGLSNSDAEIDIQMLLAGKKPNERDNYDADYLNYFNNFMTMNRFNMLPDDDKLVLTEFLKAVNLRAQLTQTLQDTMLNDASMNQAPMQPPLPSVTIRAQPSPQVSDAMAESENPAIAQQVQSQQPQTIQSQGQTPPNPQVPDVGGQVIQ